MNIGVLSTMHNEIFSDFVLCLNEFTLWFSFKSLVQLTSVICMPK